MSQVSVTSEPMRPSRSPQAEQAFKEVVDQDTEDLHLPETDKAIIRTDEPIYNSKPDRADTLKDLIQTCYDIAKNGTRLVMLEARAQQLQEHILALRRGANLRGPWITEPSALSYTAANFTDRESLDWKQGTWDEFAKDVFDEWTEVVRIRSRDARSSCRGTEDTLLAKANRLARSLDLPNVVDAEMSGLIWRAYSESLDWSIPDCLSPACRCLPSDELREMVQGASEMSRGDPWGVDRGFH